jgi:GNAT superfamily N-acetyltransferase
MSATLRIAQPADADRVMRMVLACHEEIGLSPDPADREIAVAALLEGETPGALYLIGPPSSPVGYLAVSFGHAISVGGTEAHVDELFVRPNVRRRGMAAEALRALSKMLSQHGVKALHVRVPGPGPVPGFLPRLRFAPTEGTRLTRML